MKNIHTRPKTVTQYITESLRSAILLGEIETGSRLIQDDIAKNYEVSVTPVREAIKILTTEGLLSFDSYKGAVVKNIRYEDANDIYNIRSILEPKILERSLKKYDESYLNKAISIQNDIEKCSNLYDWAILNEQFHTCFMESENHTKLYSFAISLINSSIPYVALTLMYKNSHMYKSNNEHNELINFYKNKDIDGFICLNKIHTEKTRQIIGEAINNKYKAKE